MDLSTIIDEATRLQALYEYHILDTPDEDGFDNLAQLAANICGTPFAQINFLEEERQWSKSAIGIDFKEMPREAGFCQYTIKERKSMVIENTVEDPRFKKLPFVDRDPGIRFYAGFTIKASSGPNIGTLCVLGFEPKKLTDLQLQTLETLAREVEARLELHRKNKLLETTVAFLQSSVDLMFEIDPKFLSIDKKGGQVNRLIGEYAITDGITLLPDIMPESAFNNRLERWSEHDYFEDFNDETYFINAFDELVFLEINITRSGGKWLLTGKDITKRKLAEREVQRQKKLSEAIIETLPVNFYMFGQEGKAITWNKKFMNTTGHHASELKVMSVYDIFGEDDAESLVGLLQQQEGMLQNYESNLITSSGKNLPHLLNAVHLEIDEQQYLIGTAQDISEQKKVQRNLQNLLEEKEVLLGEVYHRVKNNLAVISGFLQLEEFKNSNPEVAEVLSRNYLRVRTMGLIHDELYQQDDFVAVKFDTYLKTVIKEVAGTKKQSHPHIYIEAELEPVLLNINQALPCALIVNELISNAYEFAFENRSEGKIRVNLREEDDQIILNVADDGIGLPADFKLETSPTLGTTLVYSFSEQLKSEIDINRENGTAFSISFERRDHLHGINSHGLP